MSHFQHATAVNSASLNTIFDSRSDDWVTWHGRGVDLCYDWCGWFIRSYEETATGGSVYTVVRVDDDSIDTLLRKIRILDNSYTMAPVRAKSFLCAHFGAFHMYQTDASNRWVRDID